MDFASYKTSIKFAFWVDQNVNKPALPDIYHMSKETKPKRSRSTKSNTAELEAKIAELEARLANLSSQVQPGAARPAETRESKPAPRPAASGPTHGTLPAGMKPAPKPAPKPEPKPSPQVSHEMPEAVGEVAPAYATISSTGYTGNKYYATRKRLSYHPPNKQFTGSESTMSAPPPEPPKPKVRRGTLPAGFKP
jgi:hypothetical protein